MDDIFYPFLPSGAELSFLFPRAEAFSFVFINIVARNCKYLCFHQHRGKKKTDIFSTCVFNNIVALAFIFYSPVFSRR